MTTLPAGLRPLSRLLRIDAVFELVLALVLIAGLPLGIARAVDLPSIAVLAFGALLVPVAALLWREAAAPDRGRIRVLAAANAGTAIAGAIWLGTAGDGFNAAGTVLVALAAAGLFALAVAQIRVLRA